MFIEYFFDYVPVEERNEINVFENSCLIILFQVFITKIDFCNFFSNSNSKIKSRFFVKKDSFDLKKIFQ